MKPVEWALLAVAVSWVLQKAKRRQTLRNDDAAGVAVAFVTAFAEAYGPRSPPFLQSSYREALARASRESKFLLLYLHSPSHEDTQRFCRRTLCDEVLVDFLRANEVLVWGGDVTRGDAHAVSLVLPHSTYPHLALILASGAAGSRRVTLLATSCPLAR